MELADANALVTGASSGIGWEVARELIERGAGAVHSFDVQPPQRPLKDLVHHAIDVSEYDDVLRGMENISDQLHVLLNNAGVLVRGDVMDVTPAEMERMWRVNYLGSCNTVNAALQRNKLAGGATIAQMCSVAGLKMFPGVGGYCVTKHDVHQLIGSLPRNLAARGRPDLIVKGIYPGAVETPMTTAGSPSREAYLRQAREKWGRVHAPTTVARLIMRLLQSSKARIYLWDMERKAHVFL